jgi:MYXO-CTERM domain-containing protein
MHSKLVCGLAVLSTLVTIPALAAEPPTRGPHSCGTTGKPAWARPGDTFLAGAPTVIYLNKNGATINLANANTNAATNTVYYQYFSSSTGTRTVAPLNTTTYDWNFIKSCVAGYYEDFNVTVVDTEPTSGVYVEAIVGGSAGQMGLSDDILGIACNDQFCSLGSRSISFSFSAGHDGFGNVRNIELCNTVAHEVGHTLGLEHEQLHNDLMCYDFAPNNKSFIDQNTTCGEYDTDFQQNARPCDCTANMTNSWERLANLVGLRATETVPPVVEITQPGNGDAVPPGFVVKASATDNEAVRAVSLYIDGNQVATDTSADGTTYVMSAPTSLAPGAHTVTVQAEDRSGNTGRDDIQITISTSCDCSDDYECVGGVCKLRDGQGCSDGAQCAGGLCAQSPDGNFCTEECDLAADTCPQGFDCIAVSNTAICAPNGDPIDPGDGDGGGCGCTVGGAERAAGGVGGAAFLAMGVLLFVIRRRRRS